MTILPKEGTPAPAFTAINAEEKSVSLDQFTGKWVVIYFYPKALTPGCTVQACALRDGMSVLKSLNVEVMGISPDAPKTLKKFANAENLNFQLLSDSEHTIAVSYGAWQEKSMYGRTYMGMARMTVAVNPEGKIAKVWPKVDPKDHYDEVLAFINATS